MAVDITKPLILRPDGTIEQPSEWRGDSRADIIQDTKDRASNICAAEGITVTVYIPYAHFQRCDPPVTEVDLPEWRG